MSEVLVQGNLFEKFCVITDDGLKFVKQPTKEECLEIVDGFIRLGRQSLWLIGDAVQYLEETFGEEASSQVTSHTDYDVKTILNAARVAKLIPPHRRRKKLSYSHHEAVAVLPEKEQERLLNQATENKWNVPHMREAAREAKGSEKKDRPGKKAKKPKAEKFPVIDLKDEETIVHGADLIAKYFEEMEKNGAKLKDMSPDRKKLLHPIFVRLYGISRRMGATRK